MIAGPSYKHVWLFRAIYQSAFTNSLSAPHKWAVCTHCIPTIGGWNACCKEAATRLLVIISHIVFGGYSAFLKPLMKSLLLSTVHCFKEHLCCWEIAFVRMIRCCDKLEMHSTVVSQALLQCACCSLYVALYEPVAHFTFHSKQSWLLPEVSCSNAAWFS